MDRVEIDGRVVTLNEKVIPLDKITEVSVQVDGANQIVGCGALLIGAFFLLIGLTNLGQPSGAAFPGLLVGGATAAFAYWFLTKPRARLVSLRTGVLQLHTFRTFDAEQADEIQDRIKSAIGTSSEDEVEEWQSQPSGIPEIETDEEVASPPGVVRSYIVAGLVIAAVLYATTFIPRTEPSTSIPTEETLTRSDVNPNYPTLGKAGGADQVGNDLFLRDTVVCRNVSKDYTAQDLWALTLIGMNKRTSPRLLAYGIEPVRLKDQDGWIAVTVYDYSPGDEGVRAQAAQYYLINSTCHVLLWKFETDLS